MTVDDVLAYLAAKPKLERPVKMRSDSAMLATWIALRTDKTFRDDVLVRHGLHGCYMINETDATHEHAVANAWGHCRRMTESTWSADGERIDSDITQPPHKTRSLPTAIKQRENRHAAEDRERAYEAEMGERIRTMCPQIQAENYAKNLDEQKAREKELYGTGLDLFG